MTASKKDGPGESRSGRDMELKAAARASTKAIATLRARRTAKIERALSEANRKTGLFARK